MHGNTYRIPIRCNATGETRIYELNAEGLDDETFEFMWTDGNYACDCNRHLRFTESRDVTENKVLDWDGADPCGDERYSVFYAISPSGRRIALDDET